MKSVLALSEQFKNIFVDLICFAFQDNRKESFGFWPEVKLKAKNKDNNMPNSFTNSFDNSVEQGNFEGKTLQKFI